jgi:hypothetical protein
VAGQLNAIPAARESPEPERIETARIDAVALPDTVDLRQEWLPIGDQGHTASCVGWAVSGVLRWHLVTAGQLAPDQALSPRFIWAAAKEWYQRETFPSTFLAEDGTSLQAGLDVLVNFGAALESELPWATGIATGSVEDFNASAATRTITTYAQIKGPDRWRQWLHQSGPVLVLLQKDKHLDSGVLETFDPASASGGHAAALFGYGPGYFLVRSSWGTDWGEQGYARMSVDYAAAAVSEAYGVIV